MDPLEKNPQAQFLSRSTKQIWTEAAKLIGFAIAYWATVRLGLLFVSQPEGIASIWPASGLALAILLLNPKREWLKLLAIIFISNAVGNLSGGNSLPGSLGFALANTLEPLLGAWVLTQFCKSKITFGRTIEVIVLFGVATLSNGVTALLGAGVSALAFGAPFLKTWWVWWAADGLGMILVTPLIVTWAASQSVFRFISPRKLVEAVLPSLALIAFAWLLFGPFTIAEKPVLRNYMLFPILILLAFRYKLRGMVSVLVLVSIIAIRNTMQGLGVFAFVDHTITENLGSVQIFLSVITFSGLFLSILLTGLKQSEEELRESEDKFKYVFEYSTTGKSITLPSGEMYANKTLCDMLGYTEAELQIHKWRNITHPDDIELSQKSMDQLFSGEQKSVRFNKRFLHKNGSVVWADLSSALRRDKDGKPLYLLASINDITERKQAEEKLAQYSEHLEEMVEGRTLELREAQEQLVRHEKLVVLGQLAGSVGHELRNPLAVINNAIYFLKLAEVNNDEKVKEYLGIIQSEIYNAEKIINDLLDFARIKSTGREAVSVSDLIRPTLERFPPPDSVTVTLEIPSDLPKVYVDSQQMIQVLGNLIVNAYQSMVSTGSSAKPQTDSKLLLSVQAQADMVLIAIQDTGIGILPENMKKLFEPLFTTKPKGVGLGLVVSKKLVEANGGKIEVQSEAGAGSTFIIYLPIIRSHHE